MKSWVKGILGWLILIAIIYALPSRGLLSWLRGEVYRVNVAYPSNWEVGEMRNCRLKQPNSGESWPEFDCDVQGSRSHGMLEGTLHAYVMDVRFLGEYHVPSDDRAFTWTCTLSRDGELSCRDWKN
jgi:hypothetical protein